MRRAAFLLVLLAAGPARAQFGDFPTGGLGIQVGGVVQQAGILNFSAGTLSGGILSITVGGACPTCVIQGANTLASSVNLSGAVAVGTAQTPYFELVNTTAAAVNAQQFSPGLHLGGRGWRTGDGTSQVVDWLEQNRPVQGTGPGTELGWYSRGSAGGDVERLKLEQNGVLTLSSAGAPALVTPKIGASTAQLHTVPAVASDTIALLAAAQTLSGKTLSAPAFTGASTASGAASFDLSGGSGVFKTPLGAITLSTTASPTVIGRGANSWTFFSDAITSYPTQDGTLSLGDSTHRVANIVSYRYGSASSAVAFSATPALDCTLGVIVHVGPITGNVTGATMTAGQAGDLCTVVFAKDATATPYTTAFAGTNVRSATGTFGVGASSLLTYTFRWDDSLGTPAWVQIGAAFAVN